MRGLGALGGYVHLGELAARHQKAVVHLSEDVALRLAVSVGAGPPSVLTAEVALLGQPKCPSI